jgi:hypothetical protein
MASAALMRGFFRLTFGDWDRSHVNPRLAQLAQLGAKSPSRFVAVVLVDQGVG